MASKRGPILAALAAGASVLLGGVGTGGTDTLELQDGVVIVGTYVGGTEDTVRFRVGDDVRVFRKGEINQLTFATVAPEAPPPPQAERPGPPPQPGRVWIPGYWRWSHEQRRHVWMDGHWEVAREGWVWAPGRWERRPWGWVWVEGRWQRP